MNPLEQALREHATLKQALANAPNDSAARLRVFESYRRLFEMERALGPGRIYEALPKFRRCDCGYLHRLDFKGDCAEQMLMQYALDLTLGPFRYIVIS